MGMQRIKKMLSNFLHQSPLKLDMAGQFSPDIHQFYYLDVLDFNRSLENDESL